MSVSAKIKQYGAMRAVGMDKRQITKMIASEAFTYAVVGCIVGCSIGLLISKFLYDILITLIRLKVSPDVINVSLPLVLPFSLNGLYFNIPAIFKVSLPTVTVSPSCKGRLSS